MFADPSVLAPALASLGLDALRVPILWERVSPDDDHAPGWDWTDRLLELLEEAAIRPIAGLIHHGSGPRHTSLVAPDFAAGLAAHAARAAARYPHVYDWTPVNEPLTTARFSALYGIWYPHLSDEKSFWLALLNQVDATRLAMRAIRQVTPAARLIQTEDLGRTYGTPGTAAQAAFDNQRRWMTWDLLCGMVDGRHPLWNRLSSFGFGARLRAILADPCPPDVIGINHYLTSDRLLDERLAHYPAASHGGNGRQAYCDVEAVRVLDPGAQGLRGAIDEAWQRYRLPIAVTEVHNGCTREEQMRWLSEAWSIADDARTRGIPVVAVTAWALFGSQGWNTLLTADGEYEPGAFDVSAGTPRQTAVAATVRRRGALPQSAVGGGWWRRPDRWRFPSTPAPATIAVHRAAGVETDRRPLLITGATGTLGQALSRECAARDLACVLTSRGDLDLGDAASVAAALDRHRPWAVINAAGWVRVDEAEHDRAGCMAANADGAARLAEACEAAGIASVSFSSDLVFDGQSDGPYAEDAAIAPLSCYGESKAEMEARIASLRGTHLVVRTAAFFSPHDRYNFAVHCLGTLQDGRDFHAVDDCTITPTYVPDLCSAVLDLTIDHETGVWHLANGEALSWFEFARKLARAAGLDENRIMPLPGAEAGWTARRPPIVALTSKRGALMPSLDSAVDRFAANLAGRRAVMA